MSSPTSQQGTIKFFSYWTFQPRSSRQAASSESSVAYDLMSAIKTNRSFRGKAAIPSSIDHMIKRQSDQGFFDGDCVAVPVPGSSLLKPGSLWVPLEICNALRERGLVSDVASCLERIEPVLRSATAGRGNRCNPGDHFRTIKFSSLLDFGASRVILVDDIITRGATIAGCAMRVKASVPTAKIAAFALMRTMGLNNFEKTLEPVVGNLAFNLASSSRVP